MDSRVLVSVTAMFRLFGEPAHRRFTIEEYMQVRGILVAMTVEDALEYFMSHTDMASTAGGVESFKVNGHEMLSTFIGGRSAARV